MSQPQPDEANGQNLNPLEQLIQQYTGQPNPNEEAPQPRTFVIECNKKMSQNDGNSDNPNEWTNNFPSIKLKRGDIVSVNSAFLSSRGSGDLLNFDITNNGTRMVFEYYATHDNTNGKRAEYNMSYSSMPQDGVGGASNKGWDGMTYYDSLANNRGQPCWMNCYPANYRPMRLYRLMKTYNTISSKLNQVNGEGDGSDMIKYTNLNTTPQTPVQEPFWGYNNTPKAIVSSVEDDYVPCLYRKPKVDVEELYISQNAAPTTNLFKASYTLAKMWYIATQKSKFGGPPVNGEASMRIYFAGTGGLFQRTDREANLLSDSLGLVNNFRTGQYIKFWGTKATFGLQAYNGDAFEAGRGVQSYGPNLYVVNGYASDGVGHNGGTADRFIQMGNSQAETGNGRTAWKHNPMGMIMKIVKIYNNSSLNFPQGNNTTTEVGSGKTDIDYCPYIDVMCDGAISLAWGNPNAYTWTGNPNGVGSPYCNGVGNTDPIDPTAPPPFVKTIHHQGLNIRTWCCENRKDITTDSANNGCDVRVSEGGLFPIEEHRNKTCYVASINNNFNFESANNFRATGSNYTAKESILAQTTGTKDSFFQATTGNNNSINVSNNSLPQTLPSINYNILTANNDSTFNDNAFANDIEQTDTYPGGRFPSMYVADNQYDVYNGTENYWSVIREGTMSLGGAMYPQYIENINSATNFGLSADYEKNFLASPKGQNPVNTIPEWGGEATNHTGLYLEGRSKTTVKFFIGGSINATQTSIDNQDVFSDVAYNASLSGTDQLTGMDNFIVGAQYLPDRVALGKQTDPPTIQPNTAVIPTDFTLWGGFASYTAPVAPSIYPQWKEHSWNEQPHSETYGGKVYKTTYSKGATDLAVILGQMEQFMYIKMTNPLTGDSEVMYVMILAGFANKNSGGAYFGNNATQGTTQKTFVNSSNNNFMSPGDKTIPRMFIVKRDILGEGKKAFGGLFGLRPQAQANYNKVNVDTLEQAVGSVAVCSYFEIIDDLSDMIHTYDFKDATRSLLPTNQTNIMNTANARSVVAGTAGSGGDSYGYGGSDFIITSVPNMPYYDDDDNRSRTTQDTIWLYNSCVRDGDPSTATNSGGKAVGETNGLAWDIHYDYKDVGVDASVVYFSTSDIASLITKQFQASEDLYKTNNSGGRNPLANGTFPNSAGKVPCSSVYRPIHGPYGKNNFEDVSSKTLGGTFHQGDFCFMVAVKNKYFTRFNNQDNWRGMGNSYSIQDPSAFPADGFYKVFPQNGFSPVNREPTSNMFSIDGWTKMNWNGGRVGYQCPQMYVPEPRIEPDPEGPDTIPDFYGYDQMTPSQWIGTNTPTLLYNDQYSRFEWQYFHQSTFSRQTPQNQSNASAFGNVIANVWVNGIIGQENWDRVGGINIVNWCSPQYNFGDKGGAEVDYIDPLTEEDEVGKAFMTKLGFTSSWRALNSGSTIFNEDLNTEANADNTVANLSYKPLGTTRSDFNINQSISYTSMSDQGMPPQMNHQVYYPTQVYTPKAGGYPKDYGTEHPAGYTTYYNIKGGSAYTGTGGNQSLNWMTGTNENGFTPKALGTLNPRGYLTTDKPVDSRTSADSGAMLAYRNGGTQNAPPDYSISSDNTMIVQANLDDIKASYYQYQVGTSGLQAPELPTKNDVGYFFIMSDLIDKHEFYGSANDGSNLNAIAILSKNYTSNDFFFSFQSPVQFHIKADKTITQITQRILTPDLKAPIGIDNNSSIIYTIERPNPVPEPDVPPVFLQQAYDYMLAEQISKQQGIPFQGFMGGSLSGISQPSSAYAGSGGALNSLRQALVHSVLNPSNNQASQILNTESEIAQNLTRMPLASRIRAIRQQGVAVNPTQAVLPLIPAEQLGLQPQTTLVPDLDDPAIDPEVLSTELQRVNAGQMPLVGKKDESDDHPVGRTASGLPAYDPVREPSPTAQDAPPSFGASRTASEEARAKGQFGVASPFETMPSSVARTRQGSVEKRQARAERLSVERQGGRASDLTGQLRTKLSYAEGGMSLYQALAQTTGNHPTHKPNEKTLDAEWVDKGDGKHHPRTRPHENPYDIQTWTAGRLKQYNNDPYFHLKVKDRPGSKADRQALAVSGDKNRVKHQDMAHISAEITRRQGPPRKNKLDYGSLAAKTKPGYKKDREAPSGWSDHKTAHLHPRGVGDAHTQSSTTASAQPTVAQPPPPPPPQIQSFAL